MVNEVEPALAETKLGLELSDKAPPFPSVNVSTRLRFYNVTLPVFKITIA